MLDQQGRQIGASTTSSFGEFGFTGVPVGQTYYITVSSKRYRFAVVTVFADATTTDLNLVGLE